MHSIYYLGVFTLVIINAIGGTTWEHYKMCYFGVHTSNSSRSVNFTLMTTDINVCLGCFGRIAWVDSMNSKNNLFSDIKYFHLACANNVIAFCVNESPN